MTGLPPPGWLPIDDGRVMSVWELDGREVHIPPTFYEESGTPICGDGEREGDDMVYRATYIMAAAARDLVLRTKIDNLPLGNVNQIECPTCNHSLVEYETLSYDESKKISSWTIAQLVSFLELQKGRKADFHEMLENTSGGVMPGIGGALVGDVGTIGVSVGGMFIGIETDGHTHS